jgi:Tfp pilus assembly protein PilP
VTRAITFSFIVLSGATVFAQTPSPQAASAAQAAAPSSTDEQQGYTYNVDGRRDPFVSLAKRGQDADQNTKDARTAGLAGLGAGEVTLRGTLESQGGYVGILQGADNKTYIVRAGAKLLDGTIRTITPEAMVILQQVNDPLSLQQQREVRKMLRQTEEAK